jgi:hypothetical protein
MNQTLPRDDRFLSRKARENKVVFCTNCGASLPEQSKFCGQCGARVSAPPVEQDPDASKIEASHKAKPETAQSTDTAGTETSPQAKPQFRQSDEAKEPGFIKSAFQRPTSQEKARENITAAVVVCAAIVLLAIWEAIAVDQIFFVAAAIFLACGIGLYYNSRAAALVALAAWTINIVSLIVVLGNTPNYKPDMTDGFLTLFSLGAWLALIAAVRA